MNSRKLKKPILDLEKWRVYMDGGILPLDDLLMEEEFTQRTFISFFKFQCFFFWQIFALWPQKEATQTMGFFWGKLALKLPYFEESKFKIFIFRV
jgi:hypothetical protein